jgi:rhamnose transport system permease protein
VAGGSAPRAEWVLALVVVAECVVFAAPASGFLTLDNAFEVLRLCVEVGLLRSRSRRWSSPAASTSRWGRRWGSRRSRSARSGATAGVPLPLAAAAALLVGLAGGALNAAAIARLRCPPLIVTLGTMSLFRGVAHGVTRGAESYAGFPAAFLYLGQGYVGGVVPAQLVPFALAAAGCAWWLHRTTHGRSLYAIGHAGEAARFAGIPVGRRLAAVYLASGLAAGAAGVVYVAHLGQAKSDAGTGYELPALTAVVLGGGSIFGGRGTVGGTLLGLLALVVLQNGLRLSAMPAELAGVLTGLLLVATILLDRLAQHARRAAGAPSRAPAAQETDAVRNSQVAVLSAAALAAALIVAASNWWLVRSVRAELRAGAARAPRAPRPSPRGRPAPRPSPAAAAR